MITLLCITPSQVYAADQFRFDSWTTENGLPQASINSVLQTRDGFLWFTTYGGLVRYDGLRFQVYNTGNTPGLKTSRFLQMYEDKEGSLWAATERNGLVRYKDGKFTTFSNEQGLPDCLAIQLGEDKNRNLLLRCSKNGGNEISVFQWTGEMFSPYMLPEGEPIDYVLQRMRDGGVWYLEDSRLRKFENGRVTLDYALEFPVKRVFEDSAGRLWIAAEGTTSLLLLEDNRLTSYSEKDGLFDARYIAAYEDRQKRIWFGSADGLTVFVDGKFTSYTTADGLARGDVSTIYQDREGTIWVGTTGGLSRVTERAVTAFSVRDGIAGDNVYPITEDRTGKIWIGSWFGLTVYENGAFQNVGKKFGLSEARITALHEDREGVFWIGTLSHGVYRIKNGQIKIYPPQELPGFQVRAITEDREGNLWFGTGGGLVRFKNESFTEYRDIIFGKQIYAIHTDKQGQLWLGTDSGLIIYKNGALAALAEKDGFAGGMVRAFAEDADGTIWIGMYDSGFYRYKDGKFTRFTTNDGLFDNGAFQILEDDSGNFWISCNLGIYRIRKAELNDYAEGRIKKITSVPYNKRDGMLNSECNGGASPAGIKARDGRLWFPTQQGVAVIDSGAVPFNSQPPPVVIESLTVDATAIDVRQPVEIQPEQTYLEIHYSGLSFINPELVKFKYRLEGLDEEWIDAETRRTAYYTHLPPGKYNFRVLAANRDGVWNETGASIGITVLPPFWRTPWFLALTIFATAGVAFALYSWRVGMLERARAAQELFSQQLIESQEAERKRIAGGLHDNLGQHLIIIKNWASLGLNFTSEDAPVREQLQEISATALQALNEVRETIYDLRPYQLETIGLTNTIKFMVEQVATSSGINFTTECDEIDNLFSPEDEVIFYRTIQECVSNIVKHSRAENASVTIKRDGANIKIKISDDGRGFIPEMQPTANKRGGFGLTGLYERVRMLGGTHEIQSVLGKGTAITIYIEAKRR